MEAKLTSEKAIKDEREKKYDISYTNDYFICDLCKNKYKNKMTIIRHLKKCTGTSKPHVDSLTCEWCHLVFKNKGNLAQHWMIHGDKSRMKIEESKQYKCSVCSKSYSQNFQLTYHIRKEHFNLKARTPYCDLKKINQVWFERVLNSNTIIEMKKTGRNTLVMRKLSNNTAIKVDNTFTQVIDLHDLYPIGRSKRSLQHVQCHLCYKTYVHRDFKKHLEEIHYNIYKHKCNNCNTTFKRSYAFLRHVCGKARSVRGVKQYDDTIKIASVESLRVA